MSKGRTLKDLRNIHQLFGKQEQEGSFSEQLAAAEVAAKVETFDEIEICILNLMRNYRGWTAGEVQRALAKHPDAGTVPALMNKFANEGKFEIMAITGRANTYTLKRTPVETITSARNKAAPFVLRDPEGTRKAMDPKGVITLEDGIDLAVWKTMADYKPRTPGEIRQILVEYKFDGRQVDRRLDTLIRNNRWFDRVAKGRGRDTTYTLKKTMPMPTMSNSDPMLPAAFSEFKGNITETVAAKFAPSNIDFSGHLGHSAEAMDRGVAALEQAIAQERVEEKEDDAAHLAAAADPAVEATPAVDPSLYIVQPDDSNAQVIWKVIHDHKWYTTPEIQTLVVAGKPDISAKSAATMLSKMFQDGLLERQAVEGKFYFNYRLKEGVPMPADNRLQHRIPKETQEALQAAAKAPEQSELPMDAAPVAQEAPAQEPAASVVQSQDNTEESTMTKATQAGAAKPLVNVKAAPAPSTAPLLNTDIHIKGIAFTQAEADQLADELTALGYSDNKVRSLTLVNQTVEIKGAEFTMRELVELCDGLLKAGYGKDNVRA
ncbi:hypothetical protein [Burkholderia phage FLC9]|nr:hypothetical protein [Burkholderia phage FLC9]